MRGAVPGDRGGGGGAALTPAAVTFDEMLERHGAEVYRFLLQAARNGPDADDLYQEAALRAFRGFGRLEPGANHRAWFYRIATNAFLDHSRRASRLAPLDAASAGAIPARPDDHEARLDAASALERTAALIAALPPKQRVALVARRQHDLSYSEIAALLGCTEAAARANVHEAVRKLRDGLGDLLS